MEKKHVLQQEDWKLEKAKFVEGINYSLHQRHRIRAAARRGPTWVPMAAWCDGAVAAAVLRTPHSTPHAPPHCAAAPISCVAAVTAGATAWPAEW